MKLVQIPVFTYDELPEMIQRKVINNTIEFLIETADDGSSDDLQNALERANGMLTPWFAPEFVWEHCKKEVLELCQEYLYFRNGDIYNERMYQP